MAIRKNHLVAKSLKRQICLKNLSWQPLWISFLSPSRSMSSLGRNIGSRRKVATSINLAEVMTSRNCTVVLLCTAAQKWCTEWLGEDFIWDLTNPRGFFYGFWDLGLESLKYLYLNLDLI